MKTAVVRPARERPVWSFMLVGPGPPYLCGVAAVTLSSLLPVFLIIPRTTSLALLFVTVDRGVVGVGVVCWGGEREISTGVFVAIVDSTR
jgi:hypothetical protein